MNGSAQAEANLQRAKIRLRYADRAAASCERDTGAVSREELHFEIDIVDARRSRGATAALERLARDLSDLRRLGLARSDPARYQLDVNRFRDVQAETRGTLIVPAPGVQTTIPSGCAGVTVPPHPISPIVPAVPNNAVLHRAHGSTAVTVVVGPSGNVLGTLTTASSGDPVLDQAVENAVRLTTFAPGRVDCKPAQGEYRFTYTFPQI